MGARRLLCPNRGGVPGASSGPGVQENSAVGNREIRAAPAELLRPEGGIRREGGKYRGVAL